MNHILKLFAIAFVLASINTAHAQLPEDIRKHFDEHLVGQWTWETNWGNERITGQTTNAWDESGVAIRSVSTAVDSKGKMRVTETHGWDAASSEVVVHGFDSRGSVYTTRWKRASGTNTTEWVGNGAGTYDGKKWASQTKLRCGKDEWRYEDTTDGKPFITLGKRVTASSSSNQIQSASAQLPEAIKRHFDEHLVGQWTTEIAWGDSKQTGKASITWNADDSSLTNRWTTIDEKGAVRITELMGWDAASEVVVVQGFDSRGNTWTIHWKRPTGSSLTDWVGRGVGTAEGKKWESPGKMQFSTDSFRYEDVTDGKPYVLTAKRKDQVGTSDQPHLAWLKYLEGTWNCEEGPGNSGTVIFRSTGPAPGLVFQADLRDYAIAGILGWHADTKMLVETDVYADRKGVTGSLDREYGEITRDAFKGRGKHRFSSGDSGNQLLEYRRINDNEMTLTGTGGGEPDWIVSFKRAK